MKPVLIATGWCAWNRGHNNPQRSKLQNSPSWIHGYWLKSMEKQLIHKIEICTFIYHSECDIYLPDLPDNFYFDNIILANTPAKELPYRHDWVASVVMGATYALFNKMDFLYIEQDCLVHGLDKVLKFAQGKDICYGYGRYSYAPGWAENSLLWVRNEYLELFIPECTRIRNTPDAMPKLEERFHDLFCADFTPWPFGYGRKRPIDFSQPVFYAQQLSDEEIKKFMEL